MARTVILADDHTVVRCGLRLILEREDDLEVVAEAGDVASARDQLAEHRPDVLLLDLGMPGESTLAALPSLCEASPGTHIVVLTMESDPRCAREALATGACGYVLKDAAGDELVRAIRIVLEGGVYLHPSLGAAVVSGDTRHPTHDLTEREVEVLRLLALGYTNAEIADEIFLSRRTVETHRARLQHKLGSAKRSDLLRFAEEQGLVEVRSRA